MGPRLNKTLTATIASGASLSDVLSVYPVAISAIIMPAAWTAADLSFQGSYDGINFFDLYNDSGVEYYIPALVSQAIVLNVPLPFPYIKVRSGLTAAAVNQGAARSISFVCS